MADVIYKKGQSANLNETNVPIVDGQILVTEDTAEMYVDMSDGTRKKIGGTGQETSNGGVIFNDYENNKALGIKSSAFGTNAVAGYKAFAVSGEARGDSSVAFGGKSLGTTSVSFGGAEVHSPYGFGVGNGTKIYGHATNAIGHNHKDNADGTATHSFLAGRNNTANYTRSILLGDYLISSADSQIVLGSYNKENPNAKFIIGVGKNDQNLVNGFELLNNNSIVMNHTNNKAYGNNAVAAGSNTKAGSNVFNIVDVNVADKIIVLSSVVGIKEILDSESAIQYSCRLTENYDLYGNIIAVDETTCTITVDKIPNANATTGTLWIPSHPELGDGETVIGTGALATGDSNKASQDGSFATGCNNIAAGKYSAVFGDSNKAGYCSAIFGQYNKGHQWSLVGGYNNTVTAPFVFVAGYNNTVSKQYASALGYGNTVDGEASFITGQSSTINSKNSLSSGVNNLIDINAKESIAAGSGNKIYAPHSVALGFKNIINASSNGRSTALGSENIIGHNYCATFGKELQTGKDNQVIVGRQNVVDDQAVFIVGNGTANNAFVVKETGDAVVSGALEAKTATISGDLYANAYTGTSGKVVINSSTNTATGDSSFSGGDASQALGRFSFAFGNKSIAGTTNDNGKYAVAIGFKAKALLDGATAIGWEAEARNKYSAAFGIMTRAVADKQFVCGTWNNLDTNALFMVGNGTGNYIKNTSSTFNPNEDYYTLNSDGKTYTKQNITAFESGVTYYIRQRSSAFTVKSDGSAEVKTMGSANNSVATKKYVDDKIGYGTSLPTDVANGPEFFILYSE